MTKLRCPFCKEEIISDMCFIFDKENRDYTDGRQIYKCNKCGLFGNKKLVQALIDTKKKLDTCVNVLKKLSLGNVPSLPDDETLALAMCNYARDTLKQIKDKEQQ